MTERNIVILGASYAGLNTTHYLARHVLPKLDSPHKIILVDPSTQFYLTHASPRAIASYDLMPESIMFHDIATGVKQYGDKVKFIQGSALSWDPESRIVRIQRSESGYEESISYHALILATGTKTSSPLFTLQGVSHYDAQEALDAIHKQLTSAKRIVIAGGGPAAVETAGELGELLNGTAGWFSSRPSNPKAKITLYTNSSKLLPILRESVAKQAEGYLNRVGVDVVYNTKVSSAKKEPNGKTKVQLHDGEEVVADIYIPAMGVQPMNQYIPKALLDASGYVKTNEKTLRVDQAGALVYAIGDIGSYSSNSIVDIYDSVPVLGTNIERDLRAGNGKPAGPDREFKGKPTTQLVPVGRGKGVGEVFGWKVPSFFVWLIKGRDFMSGRARDDHLMGNKWIKESSWKSSEA
ncbi:Oxidoreductase phnG [Pseudocercospora fuligena]|uniref:Oxidoreductase phnG n=1 Tax=Pseudocercospora fuligena TaxID=685502 RepID=A0A8H6RAB5_9PEZI|nr:Oxidoreductase phnG [Pseudocercospora fuligena]